MKLRNLKVKANEEYKQVIKVYLEKDHLITRFNLFDSGEVLTHDPEYQSAIYNALPKAYQ